MTDSLISLASPRVCVSGRSLLVGLFLVFAAALTTSAADSATGTITGRVSNAATGSYLESAAVSIEGSSAQTATARGGEFTLVVPAGRHTLVVGYTGLDTVRETVEVAAGAV